MLDGLSGPQQVHTKMFGRGSGCLISLQFAKCVAEN